MTAQRFMDWNGERVRLLDRVNDIVDQLDPFNFAAWEAASDAAEQEVLRDVFGGSEPHVEPRSKYIITDPWSEAPKEAAVAGCRRPVEGFDWPPRRPGSLEDFCGQEGVHSVVLDAEGAVCSFRMEETLFRTQERSSGVTGAYDVIGDARRRWLLKRLGRQEQEGPRDEDEHARDVRIMLDGLHRRPVM